MSIVTSPDPTPSRWLPEGVYVPARLCFSPNCDARPAGLPVTLVVLHNISLPPGQYGGPGVEQLFTNALNPCDHPYYEAIAGIEVSAHFFIRRTGELIQFVPCDLRAWHAGISCWQGQERCNEFSIGIELEGCDEDPFESAQYGTLIALLEDLRGRYPINAIAGHEHIAPGRKTDPGPCFDWQQIKSNHPDLTLPTRF